MSDAVEAVLAKALAVPTQERYQTAGELWNALRAAVGLSPMRAITGNRTESASDRSRRAPSRPPRLVAAGDRRRSPPRRARRAGSWQALARPGLAARRHCRSSSSPASRGRSRLRQPATLPRPSSRAPPRARRAVAPPPKPAAPTCPDGMVLIPGGKFFMGSDDKSDFPFERPAHQVTLAPFCIDKFEVTVARYKACSDKGECKRAGTTNDWEKITDDDRKAFDPLCNARDPDEKAKHPINCVNWEMADTFCKAAAPRGRLPREAEWEFAARGSDGRKFPWGDDWPDAKHLNACDKECLAWGKKNHVERKGDVRGERRLREHGPRRLVPARRFAVRPGRRRRQRLGVDGRLVRPLRRRGRRRTRTGRRPRSTETGGSSAAAPGTAPTLRGSDPPSATTTPPRSGAMASVSAARLTSRARKSAGSSPVRESRLGHLDALRAMSAVAYC